MPRKFLVLHVVLLNLVFCSAAYSCSYVNAWWKTNPPCAKYDKANLVALGKVTKIDIIDNDDKESFRSDKVQILRFAVEESFKGTTKKIIYLKTSYEVTSCGFDSYDIGDKFLIYSSTEENRAQSYRIDVDQTFPNSDDFEKELKYLRLAKKGRAGATISGIFVSLNREEIDDSVKDTGIAGAEVLIENEKSKHKIKTDKDGELLLYGLTAGTYKITTDLLNWSGEKMTGEITLENDSCEEISGAISDQSAIKGVLLDPKGGFAAKVELELIAIDPETGEPSDDMLSRSANESGEFYFENVPAGKYFLAHNIEGEKDSDELQFETSFYPGTNDVRFGSIIEVKDRQDVDLGVYRLTGAAVK